MRRVLLLVAALLGSGCAEDAAVGAGDSEGTAAAATTTSASSVAADSTDEGTGQGASTALGTSTGAAADESTGHDTEAEPTVPTTAPTDATLPLDFRVALQGAGSLLVGGIDIVDGFGTVEIEGTSLPVIVVERQPWPRQGYTLYQSIAVASDG